MDSLRSFSSTCGRCSYSACICFKTASKVAPSEYAPFGIYPGAIPATEINNGRGYGGSTGFRSEIDGLQAGVNYLDTLEDTTKETPFWPFYRNPCERPPGKRSPDGHRIWVGLENAHEKLATHDAPTFPFLTPSNYTFGFGPYDSYPDQSFQDFTLPSFFEADDDLWKIEFDNAGTQWDDEGNEWPELSEFFPPHFFPASGPAQEQSTGVAYGSIPTHSHERGYGSQQYTGSKELPAINVVPSEETTNMEIDELSTITKKVPQKSQWATLQGLRLSSRLHYMKFLQLTANHDSRGIKMLRRMYSNPKGMLDAGITTFGNVLDGQEPQSLKEIFAFTCLSYVMSKLLQKHGRMGGSQVLADTDRWRLAIKKEKHRLVYDQAVKILWPEIDFLKEHSKEKYANSIPHPTGPLNIPSSMLASGMTASSDFNFLERTQAADYSNIENDMQSALQDSDSRLDPDNQPGDHGMLDHLTELLQETSTHDNFKFSDYLNVSDQAWDTNIDLTSKKLPPDITPMTHPPDRPSQMFPPNEPVGTLDPKKLGSSSPPIAGSEVLVQIKSLSPKADQIPTVLPLLSLIDTIMFQVAVAFVKFITSLGGLLFHLSGCGITSCRKKHEVEGYIRPVQEFGEFVTGAVKHVLEPIKEDLGEADESVGAVLCMADTFVRLGRLHTVREIEEYIITTARHLACDYKSFTTIVSKTLKRCLAASDQMTWDHLYPSYAADQEDYSTTYIKKTEATEIEWALQNFKKEVDGENNVNFTTTNVIQTAESIIARRESNSFSNSDSLPSKKQKLSTPSPNSSNERQSSTAPASSSGGDLPVPSKAQCHYANCKKSYTGNHARVNLRRHIRIVHEGCRAIKCPTCGHESSRRDNVRKHFLLKHKGEKVPAVLMCKTRA